MAREVRLMVQCDSCPTYDIAIRENEREAEKAVEERGWLVSPKQKCPKCRKGKKS